MGIVGFQWPAGLGEDGIPSVVVDQADLPLGISDELLSCLEKVMVLKHWKGGEERKKKKKDMPLQIGDWWMSAPHPFLTFQKNRCTCHWNHPFRVH